MANPTTNFGWVMPTSTDLVTDLPADFNVFGQAVDTSMADLKGGTTGQILSKTTSADMDFTWVAPSAADITGVTAGTGISGGGTSGDVTVTNSMATAIDAKGDLIAGTGADAFSRLAIGTNNQVLTADSAQATGMKWATPTAAGQSFSLLGTGTTTSGTTVTVSGISGINTIYILLLGVSDSATGQPQVKLRINGDTASNYYGQGIQNNYSTSYFGADFDVYNAGGLDSYVLANFSTTAASVMRGGITITGCNSSGLKMITSMVASNIAGGSAQNQRFITGYYSGTSTVSSVSLVTGGTAFDAGTFQVYGSA